MEALEGSPLARHGADSRGPDIATQDRLLARYHRDREPAVRDELVERFLPLARHLALRYRHGKEPVDDLVQVATIGLIKALDRFDPGHGAAFSSYAVPTILGELKRHFRDQGWAVHVPRGIKERAQAVDQAITRLAGRLGRSPSPGELAEELDMPVDEVLEAMDAGQAYDALSLEAPRTGTDGEADGGVFGEQLGQEDARLAMVEDLSTVSQAMSALPERERLILRLRFEKDMTQAEIGELVGISQMHVSRLLRRSLEQLRRSARAGEPDGDAPPARLS
jgi:RNA polymerase sigma-B factor